MPDKEVLKAEMERELEAMEILLWANSARTAITLEEYIRMRTVMGISKAKIKTELLTDLAEGGRIFGEYRNAIRATANGIMGRARDAAQFSELGIAGKYRWVAILVNTCPDCLARHGKVKLWGAWEAEGLPRTGHTVCKYNCKCMLLPVETTEMKPVKRAKI